MPQFTLTYLSRDALWQTEKPYFFESVPKSGLLGPRTNYVRENREATINPTNSSVAFDLDIHGFSILKEQTDLDPEIALADPDKVQEAYTSQIADILRRHFPQYRRLEAIDFVVRRRDARFPTEDTIDVTHQQPAGLMHTDYSIEGALMQLHYTFPGNEDALKGRDYDMLNVWKPLIGPNDDWPLAVCDYTSIDPEKDIIRADLLYNVRIGENQLLHYNPEHRYYYIPAQQPDDLFVFRNTDSSGTRPMGFHGSFPNPEAEGPLRTSCEVRFVAFR
ncbi:Aspirochlorine biosynthesis protein N-like protein 4 [Elsinoe fawcettii]|nr:Aspirochlorine biosynthesis protein N-like protein 4 [Elsinoe fawcettii]